MIVGLILVPAGLALLLAAARAPMGKGFRVLLAITAASICAAGVLAIAGEEPLAQAPESPVTAIPDASERTAGFRAYMKDNFGGGYGQEPVSWYGAIVDVQFDEDGRLLIETSLTSSDVEAVNSIATAVNFFDDRPASLEIRGGDGTVLY